MSEFTLLSGVKTLDIKGANGEIIKTFSINVGQKEQTKAWMKEIQEVQKVSAKLSEDVNSIDQLAEMEQKIVSSILGVEGWTLLWKTCGENVLVMLGLVQHLSKFLTDAMKEFYDSYV
jgi:hypothetical protein